MANKLKLVILIFLIPMTCVFSQSGLGTIKGTVKDEISKQPLPYTKIFLLQNGATKGNANTDFDGNFQINGVSPGSYDVEVRNADGYQTSVISGVSVSPDKITFLDKLTLDKPKDIKDLDEISVIAYRVPLIDKDGGSTGGTVTRDDIARLPVRSAAGVAQTVGGVNSNESSGAISVRGSREDGTYFY
ncbi:MAG: carboxypeptidase regulatory-like domain-containing protein, partial [Flavobacteriia bacterium]|nr:carboxypeptidase regulatory-like domain-containing protein [Flavobacteriia bacterium]